MLTAVDQGRLTLPQLVRLMSERAATLFELPGKGRVAEGFDADLTLVDLGASWSFDTAAALSHARGTMRVYDGWRMKGRVISTIVRGVRVFHEGDILGSPGFGQLVRPAFQTDVTPPDVDRTARA